MIRIVSLCCLLVGTTSISMSALAQPLPSARDKAIRKLLHVSRADEAANVTKAQMQNQLRTLFKQVPETFWTQFFRELDGDELTTKLVAIYAKQFSDKDVADLIAFYESPIGKKLVAAQPQILAESTAAGGEWGRSVAERVMKRLKEQGLLDGGAKKK